MNLSNASGNFKIRNQRATNPIISSKITVQFVIENSNKSKIIKIPVPVKKKYIDAFKSENGFRDNYVAFLSDTYGFIMERL